MELLCIQSQEHDKLPLAELNAVIECEDMELDISKITEGLILLKDISDENSDKYYQTLVKRLGYTHEVDEVIFKSSIDDLEKDILAIDWSRYISKNFAVRVKRFNSPIDTVAAERKTGSLILSKCDNIKVKLKKPDSLIRLIAYENTVYIAIEKFKLNKKHFEEIKPHKRPFFYPGSMSPKLARCMVNLSRVNSGDLVLDPFCGTGGILIEAGLIGCKVAGSDVNCQRLGQYPQRLHRADVLRRPVAEISLRPARADLQPLKGGHGRHPLRHARRKAHAALRPRQQPRNAGAGV